MDKTKFWNSFADEYAKNILNKQKRIEEKTNWLIENFDLNGKSILEIGPGPGTYTIPLSKVAKNITVVEQSSSMIEILKDRLRKNAINNVNIIHDDWEDVEDVGKYYFVFSSYSLIVSNMKEALRKINRSSCGYCCILTFGNEPPWRRLHNKISKFLLGRESRQNYNQIYDELLDLGIKPKLIMDERPYVQRFKTIDGAVGSYLKRFQCIEMDRGKLIKIKHIVSEEFKKTVDGYELKGKSIDATIWWKAEL